MKTIQANQEITQILQAGAEILPSYLANPIDQSISNGNVSMCIVDENGEVYGAMWGSDKIRQRETYQTAWRKASQVWITGIATGKYETLVYTNQIDWFKNGISKPDFIGWEGGWPIQLKDGSIIAVAVSGMRGETDTDMALKAGQAVGGEPIRF